MLEESSQQVFAFFSQDTAEHFDLVIKRQAVHIDQRTERTAPGIETAEHEPLDPCLHDGAGAHHAGFLGHVERAAYQPEILHYPGCFHYRKNFRVRDRGLVLQGKIVRSGYGLSVGRDHERADGHLIGRVSPLGLVEAELHKGFIAHRVTI
ncbi:MAG TPA: hypothetical protein VMB77_12950 [Syntrophales bacterium]|nr:hypothetical protein [Syntrophales bacterium]